MEPRILSAFDIEALSAQVDFMGACDTFIITADLRPIDMAAGHARQALEAYARLPGAPFYSYEGSRRHPPPPEHMLAYTRADKREGWTESAQFHVYGAMLGQTALLLFKPASTPQSASKLWGILPEGQKLCYQRNLPYEVASALSTEKLEYALALYEADLIAQGTKPGSPPAKAPSI